MSVQGVRQLRRLVISYNATAGGSAGLRDYMSHHIYGFAAANPQVDIIARPIYLRGTATVTASWLNGRRETLPLANLNATEVMTKLERLRDRTGADERDLRFVSPKSKHPSIQGRWSVDTNLTKKNDLTKPNLVINGKYNTPPPNPWDVKITLVTEGLPHPNTGKDWEEVAKDSVLLLAKHKAEKEARIKAEKVEAQWALKNPALAAEKRKKLMIEQKATVAKNTASEEAEKKKVKAAVTAPKAKK